MFVVGKDELYFEKEQTNMTLLFFFSFDCLSFFSMGVGWKVVNVSILLFLAYHNGK